MKSDPLLLEDVVTRRKELIRNKLWDSLSTTDLQAWVNQFKTDVDKKIAMIALDALIVRSKDSAIASIWNLICSVIPEIINDKNCWNEDGVIPYDLLRDPQHNIRIIRLEPSESLYSSGQSSDDLIRLLKEMFCAHEHYFGEPDMNSHVILLDEFSGSGNQAKGAIDDWITRWGSSYKDISLYFLAIHKKGYKEIIDKHPDVKIYFGELLGDETSLAKILIDNKLADNINDANQLLIDFTIKHFSEDEEWRQLGYKDMAICYKPPFTACNNMAGLYLSETLDSKTRLFQRGLSK